MAECPDCARLRARLDQALAALQAAQRLTRQMREHYVQTGRLTNNKSLPQAFLRAEQAVDAVLLTDAKGGTR